MFLIEHTHFEMFRNIFFDWAHSFQMFQFFIEANTLKIVYFWSHLVYLVRIKLSAFQV